jgi:hypothetical protein
LTPFPRSEYRLQADKTTLTRVNAVLPTRSPWSSEYRLQAEKTHLTRVNAVLPTPSPCSYAMALPFPPFPDGKIAPGDKFLGRVGPAEDDPLPGRDLHPAEPGRDCITGAKNQRPGGPDPPAGS